MATIYDTLDPMLKTKGGAEVPRAGAPVQNGGGIYPQQPQVAANTVNPPGVAMGPDGRPVAPTAPSPVATLAPPTAPTAPAQPAQATQQTMYQQVAPMAQPALGTQPPAQGGVATAPVAPAPIPAAGPLAAPSTKFGPLTSTPGGGANVQLDQQAKQKIAEMRVRALKAYGDYPGSDDPGAPVPPIVVGKPNVNPWTGEWS